MHLRIEANYLEDHRARHHGRPATGYEKGRVIASLEKCQRNRLVILGLNDRQADAAMAMVRHGYTVEAAARLTLAGSRS